MSNYSSLKSAIDANIKANGRREITGPVLNAILNAVVNSLGDGYLFRGVAIPSTNPGTPDQNVAYLAITEGTYTHMGGLSVTDGELSVFSYNGAWSKIPLALVPTKTSQLDNDLRFVTLEEMGEGLSLKQDTIQDLSEIRSGAALGATAYQKPSAGIPASDMTSAVQNSLQLADNSDHRPYNSSNPDGMGYLVLKKNKTFAEQVTEEDTIYEIRYAFSISGDFTMPSGCVLFFNGGSIDGGSNYYTLNGDGTLIMGDYVFENLSFDGTFSNENVVIDNHHFGTFVDLEGILHAFTKASLELRRDVVQATLAGNKPFAQIVINGNGHSIKTPCLYHSVYSIPFQHAAIDNVVFDCSLQTSEKRMLHFWGAGVQHASVTNCVFNNASYFGPVFFEKCSNPVFMGNAITGTLDRQYVEDIFNSQESNARDFAVSFYNCKGFICCVGNRISNVNIGAILLTSPEQYSDTTGEVKSNIIEDIAGGGIKGWGNSIIYNFSISYNTISNTDCFNTSGTAGVYNDTDKAAVNVHGFKNLVFENNYIHDITYANTLDFDGVLNEDGTITQGSGIGLKVIGNTLDKVTHVIFNACMDVEFSSNIIRDIQSRVVLQGITNSRVCNNQIKQIANNYPPGTSTPSIYNAYVPIQYSQSTYFNDIGEVEIVGNNIIAGDYIDSFLWFAGSLTTTKKIVIKENVSRGASYPYSQLLYRCADSLVTYIKTNDIEKNFVLIKDSMPLALLYANENVGFFGGQFEEIKGIVISKTDSEYIGSQNILITRVKKSVAELTMVTITISAKNPGSTSLVVPLTSSIRLNAANIRSVLLKLDNPTDGNYLITLKVAPPDARRWIAYQESDMTPITITV